MAVPSALATSARRLVIHQMPPSRTEPVETTSGTSSSTRQVVSGSGSCGHVGAQADLLERHGRKVQHRGAADFLDAVDLAVILVRLFRDPLARFGHQGVAVAGLGGADRAGFRAGGDFALASAARSTCRTSASAAAAADHS